MTEIIAARPLRWLQHLLKCEFRCFDEKRNGLNLKRKYTKQIHGPFTEYSITHMFAYSTSSGCTKYIQNLACYILEIKRTVKLAWCLSAWGLRGKAKTSKQRCNDEC